MKKLTTILLLFLVITGFAYRLVGIQKGLSFWNDESHTALMARGILWYGQPVTPIGVGNGLYQVAFYYLTAAAFAIGGVNELAGRLPEVLAGTILIAAVFFVGQRVLGTKQALLAAFLTAFSQIQLAWSTQLRPYVWLELISLLVIYFSYAFLQNRKAMIDQNLLLAVGLSFVAALFHGSGLINFGFVGLALLIKTAETRKYQYLLVAFLFGIVAISMAYLSGPWFFQYYLFKVSLETAHYRVFLTHNYLWLLVPAFLGATVIFRRDKYLFCFFPVIAGFIFLFANFKINPDYVRYSLSAFPLLYLLFAEGVVRLKKIGVLFLIVSLLFAVVQGKLLLFPRYYYSINADMRENPLVDYKLAFAKIKILIGGRKDVIIMDAWNDRVPYYLPNQKFVMINTLADRINSDPVYGERYVKNLPEFEAEKAKYVSGIVIVENWESYESEEIKGHIHTNLKHEFDVNNLPYNDNDRWSISVYSWGL